MPEIINVNQSKCVRPMIVNGDAGPSFCGTGDLILLSYISCGCPDELQIKTRDGKKGCLKYFDIQLEENRPGISASGIFDQEVRDKGAIPRLQRACDFFRIKGQPKRPTITLPDFSKEAAIKFWEGLDQKILFCPQTNDNSRSWPHWGSLSRRIGSNRKRELNREVALGLAPLESETWAVAMAIIESCDLFVGLDSAYAHLAGVFQKPAIVILGPTKPGVFAHESSIECLTPPSGGPHLCSGCSYSHPFDRKCVLHGCREIERIGPDVVFAAIQTKLQNL